MLNKFLFAYINDILIFSETKEKGMQHVQLVLRRLQGQLPPDPAKVHVVDSVHPKQLQQFLGFANFYHRFIRDYSKVAALL